MRQLVSHETQTPDDPPFVIFALPRSRTYWLSKFLTVRGWHCEHEESRHVRGLADVRAFLSLPRVGTIETAAAPFWRLVRTICPGAHVAVIRRPVDDVVDSLMRLPLPFDRAVLTANMTRLDRKLDQICARVDNVMTVNYADLADEEYCARLFEHCLPLQHDSGWWRRMSAINLQCDLPAMLRYAMAFAPQIQQAASICGQESRYAIWQGRPDPEIDGMTIAEDTFEGFWRDGQGLFREHCVAVGEAAEQFLDKNVALLRKLSDIGAVQFMTARSNGRMFGYLVTLLGPSLEDPALNVATQTTFYAAKDAPPGLGIKLQRASVAALKQMGGPWTVVGRAGVRGNGAKMGALFRRMGAEDFGQLYKLDLEAA